MMALAMVIPWILAISISSLLFAKNTRQGIFIGIYLAIGYIILGSAAYLGSTYILQSATGTSIGTGVIDGIFRGLTDLHPLLAIVLASIEGCLIGGVFGALIGSLKYKPGEEEYTPKMRKKKDKPEETSNSDSTSDFPFEVGEY